MSKRTKRHSVSVSRPMYARLLALVDEIGDSASCSSLVEEWIADQGDMVSAGTARHLARLTAEWEARGEAQRLAAFAVRDAAIREAEKRRAMAVKASHAATVARARRAASLDDLDAPTPKSGRSPPGTLTIREAIDGRARAGVAQARARKAGKGTGAKVEIQRGRDVPSEARPNGQRVPIAKPAVKW